MKEINLFGAKINPLTMQETIAFIEGNIVHHKTNMQHTVVNVAKLVCLQKDKKLKEAVNNSDLVNVDGMPILWVARLLGHKIPERIAGIDLFQALVKFASKKGYKPYFLGGTPEVIQLVTSTFRSLYPTLSIAGCHNGYFAEADEKKVAEIIARARADMLFVGMPSPRKELFLHKYKDYLNIPFVMGVGGSFDVVAGKKKRAPRWIQRIGMEWLYRFLQEPRRMWKRYLFTNSVFLLMVFKGITKKLFRSTRLRKLSLPVSLEMKPEKKRRAVDESG